MWKLKGKRLPTATERIKALEERLDAAVAESKRLRHAVDALRQRQELRDLRKRLRKQSQLTGTDVGRDDEAVH